MDATTAIDHVKSLLAQFGLNVQLSSTPGRAIEGRILLPGGALPVVILPEGDAWRLALSQGTTVNGAVKALSPLLGGDNVLAAVLPSDLLELANLGLEVLNIQFDTPLTVPVKVSYTLRAPSPWVLFKDKLVLHDLRCDVVVLQPLGNARLRLELSGKLRVGGIDVPLAASVPHAIDQFDLPDAIKDWPLTLKDFADELTLDALLDALGLGAVREALHKLPGDLSQIGMPLSGLDLIWDVADNSLRTVNVHLAAQQAKLDADLKICKTSFEITQFEVGYDGGDDTWSVRGAAKLTLSGLPAKLRDVFPAELTGRLDVLKIAGSDDYEVIASTDAPDKLRDIDFGLRKLAMDLANLELKWPDGEPEFSCDLGVETGNGALAAFVGIPQLPLKDKLRFRVTLNPAQKDHPLLLTLLEWPFTVFDVPMHEGSLHVDLGEWGEADVVLPAFGLKSLTAGEFDGAGTITVQKVAVPLPFLHDLADAVGLGKYVPPRISIIEGGKPTALPDIVGLLGVEKECLPARASQYRDVNLPNAFDYSVKVATNGGLDIGVSPQPGNPGQPIAAKALASAGVTVMGTQLHQLAWGELFGLQSVKVSAEGDLFIPSLVAALALVNCNGSITLLPRSSELTTRWNLGNVRLLLIPPIPIPIFFNPLEFEYLGVEGLGIHLWWSFPEPSLLAQVDLVSKIIAFLTTPNQTLTPENLPEELQLKAEPLLAVTMPKYLGGKKLEASLVADGRDVVAGMLNFLKNPATGVVTAIPRRYRSGRTDLALGPIQLNAAWAITSAGEWRDAGTMAGLPSEAVDVAMRVLSSATNYQYGKIKAGAELAPSPLADAIMVSSNSMLILLNGGVELGNLVSGSCTVGLALVGSGGFATAVSIACKLLGDTLGLQLDAVVRVFRDGDNLSLLAGGRAAITLFEWPLFDLGVIVTNEGADENTDKRFGLRGKVQLPSLLPIGGEFVVEGSLDKNGVFDISGDFNAEILGFPIGAANFSLSNHGEQYLKVGCELLGLVTELTLKDNLSLVGKLDLVDKLLHIDVGELIEPNTGFVVWPAIKLDVPIPGKMEASVTVGPTEFALTLSLSLDLAGMKLNIPEFTLRWSGVPKNLDQVLDDIAAQVKEYLLKRPLGLLAGGGILNPLTWVAFALNLAEKWGGMLSDNFKKLVDNAGKELSQLRDDALAGMTRWAPETWNLALDWNPSDWAKVAALPVFVWDLALSFNWGFDPWNRLVLQLPADFWDVGNLVEEVTVEQFAELVVKMAQITGIPTSQVLEVAAKMFASSPEIAKELTDKVGGVLKQLDPGSIFKVNVPKIKVKL